MAVAHNDHIRIDPPRLGDNGITRLPTTNPPFCRKTVSLQAVDRGCYDALCALSLIDCRRIGESVRFNAIHVAGREHVRGIDDTKDMKPGLLHRRSACGEIEYAIALRRPVEGYKQGIEHDVSPNLLTAHDVPLCRNGKYRAVHGCAA